jgi:hypothetical protein
MFLVLSCILIYDGALSKPLPCDFLYNLWLDRQNTYVTILIKNPFADDENCSISL